MKILRCDRIHPGIECFCSKPHRVNDEIIRILDIWLDENQHCSPCCGSVVDELYDRIEDFRNGDNCSP